LEQVVGELSLLAAPHGGAADEHEQLTGQVADLAR
jgi:hypothetical protein